MQYTNPTSVTDRPTTSKFRVPRECPGFSNSEPNQGCSSRPTAQELNKKYKKSQSLCT